MSNEQNTVAIIIVGLNACQYVKECLESIGTAEWRYCSYEIIYIDNGSKDDSLSMLQAFPQVKVIANPTNRGFCPAANQGAAIADSKYYFFLNDDTLVLKDAIPLLVEFSEKTANAGIVGARLLNTDLTDQWSGRRFPSLLNALAGRRAWLSKIFPNNKSLKSYLCKDELNTTEPFVVDWVSAAALLVSRELFHAVGGFAEDYYYWHEAVFCDRVKKLGGLSYLHPLSKIVHHEGKGSGHRPIGRQVVLLIDFHRGAYRCYLEHYEISHFHPRALIALAGLSVRAVGLMTGSYIRHIVNQLRAGS
jgi:GT2 family glycosyltransferase